MLDLIDFAQLQLRPEDFAGAPAVSLDGEAIPDMLPEKWEHLLRHNPRARKVWEATCYPSVSEHAYALMYTCGLLGCTKAEAAAVHVALYDRHVRKRDGVRKARYALRAWQKGRERLEAWERGGGNGQPPERGPGESAFTGDGGQGQAEDHGATDRDGAGEDAIPQIRLGNRRLSDKSRDALRALTLTNARTPHLFQQGGALVRLHYDDTIPRVEALNADALRGELDRAAFWMTKNDTLIDPPMAVVRDVLSLPNYDFPRLRAVVEVPFFTEEGRLVVTPGYHADAGIFLHLPPGLVIPEVPEEPSPKDLQRAKTLIVNEMFVDFPFTDEASGAHAVALLALPVVRALVDGPTPLHAIDSPMPGTGKGLLADVIASVTTGRPIEVMTEARDVEELRKRITALLLAGSPLGLFDNVTRRLGSGVLAALLTASTWSDRILGASRMVRVPIRTTWIATGNNLQFSREIARRTVWIRLDAKVPSPHRRTGFRHDPLGGWVLGERSPLLWAVLTLVQHWVAEGRPRFTARRLGSYEAWGEVVGGILGAVGMGDFLGNLETFTSSTDHETTDWACFIAAWWRTFADRPVDVGALCPLAVDLLPEVVGDGSERSQHIRLGRAISHRSGWTLEIPSQGLCVRLELHGVTDEKGRERNGWRLVRS